MGGDYMKNTGKKLILISLMLAVVSSAVIFIYLKTLKTSNTTVKEKTILVAVETIPPRTIIEKKMVKEVEVPDNAVFENYIVDSSNIVGKYTKETIFINEGFHKDKLMNEINNELTSKIEGNNRAISINITGSTGVSDLIKQGDYVDVIMYLPEKKEGQEIVRPDVSRILLQNIQVLAVDKVLYRDGEQRTEIPTNYLATLSVSIFDMEKLVLAEDIGQLKLALRPLNSDSIHKTEGAIWQELILDDSKEMRNLFPEYKNKSVEEDKVSIDNNKYEKYVYYKIEKGDTLRKISKDFYGDPEKYILIKDANGINDQNIIKAGTNLKSKVYSKSSAE